MIAVLLSELSARSAAADVPLAEAIAAAESALAACKAQGYHVTVAILDANFATRVILRSDGASGRQVRPSVSPGPGRPAPGTRRRGLHETHCANFLSGS